MGHQQGSVNHQGQLNQWNTNVVHELTITRELKSEESRRIERSFGSIVIDTVRPDSNT